MTNLPREITNRAKGLIFKFDFSEFDFKNIDDGQPFTLNYEKKRYRQNELASLLFHVLPFFALKEEEFKEFQENSKGPRYIEQEAINRIVKPGKMAGDYGEMILFLLLELFYGSRKLVTKVFYKTSNSLPVFRSDAIHFTKDEDDKIILWFGESKIYKKFSDAITAAFNSVDSFLKTKMNDEIEFLIPSRIEINKGADENLRDKVIELIESKLSLDDITIKIPVLITYELGNLKKFNDIFSDDFTKNMKMEFEERYKQIQLKNWKKYYKNVSFVFFLLPIQDIKDIKKLIQEGDKGARV